MNGVEQIQGVVFFNQLLISEVFLQYFAAGKTCGGGQLAAKVGAGMTKVGTGVTISRRVWTAVAKLIGCSMEF